MRRFAPLLLLLVAVPASGKPLLKPTPADKAVDRALAFLSNTQNRRDGSWTAGKSGKSVAVTSLAVMAFLSAGHVPGEGVYGKQVEQGVRWLLDQQQPNGLIATDGALEMYHHGIATLLLAEVAGMLDAGRGKEVRAALEKAVAVILKAQRREGDDAGGWRYRLAHLQGADVSVTGWQIMALRGAKNVGCDVPTATIDRAVAYVKRCQDARTGGFRYRPFVPVTVPCTGVGVLTLELSGKEEHRSEAVLSAAAFLIRAENLPRWGDEHFFYGVYHGAQATFQVGGNYWSAYRARLHTVLLRQQSSSGSWLGGVSDSPHGPNYCTAMAVLALTVEHRYLPIYQAGEEKR